VNNEEAKKHGLRVVGLPSRKARFTRTHSNPPSPPSPPSLRSPWSPWSPWSPRSPRSTSTPTRDWWGLLGPRETSTVHIYNADARGRKPTPPVCSIDMSSTQERGGERNNGQGYANRILPPKIQMFLPSFSGATALCPDILKYSLRLSTRIRFLKPVRVITPNISHPNERNEPNDRRKRAAGNRDAHVNDDIEAFIGQLVLCGRPLVCMSFEDMTMEVQAPERMAISPRT